MPHMPKTSLLCVNLFFFTQVKFMHHRINQPLQSVQFSGVQYFHKVVQAPPLLVPKHFHHPKGNPMPLAPTRPPQPQATPACSVSLAICPVLDVLYKWNHIICGLWLQMC